MLTDALHVDFCDKFAHLCRLGFKYSFQTLGALKVQRAWICSGEVSHVRTGHSGTENLIITKITSRQVQTIFDRCEILSGALPGKLQRQHIEGKLYFERRGFPFWWSLTRYQNCRISRGQLEERGRDPLCDQYGQGMHAFVEGRSWGRVSCICFLRRGYNYDFLILDNRKSWAKNVFIIC